MKILIQSRMPALKGDTLTAVIELDGARPLCRAATLKAHPASDDLARRRRQGALKSAYLAVGASPLLALPGEAVKYWDNDEKVRLLAARAWDAACGRKARRLVFVLDTAAGAEAAPLAAAGLALRAYRFDKYKKKNDDDDGKAQTPQVTMVVPTKGLAATRSAVGRQLDLVEATNQARDLVNEPGTVASPAEIERRARALARQTGLGITVLSAAQLARQGYRGLLTVGRGSEVPPRMVVLRHRPRRKKGTAAGAPHLGLLGKGLTFDTGGVCLKPGAKMWEMKGDMAGAAAVLAAMGAIARADLPLCVTGILVLSSNSIGSRATLPGDIFSARNGKSVHIGHTDAEGRLILTDGLWRMGEEKVTHLVDMATLTGACQRALGPALTGLFSNDPLGEAVARAAQTQGEPCWRMPIIEEYRPWLDNELADVDNISSKVHAGATTAALFLREFVPEGVEWCHLDIAGTFLADGHYKYYRPGATGIMTRSMFALAESMAD